MNITQRPVFQKTPKEPSDPEYLDRVRGLPCVICTAFGEAQRSPTTAHHPIHQRGSFRKVPDRQAIPLCEGHHLGAFDTSKTAIHREPSKWKRLYGDDTQYTAVTLDRLGE
jgi:hypothetical protein